MAADGVEVSAFLVGAPVFKTGGRCSAPPAGSIPVHLRHQLKHGCSAAGHETGDAADPTPSAPSAAGLMGRCAVMAPCWHIVGTNRLRRLSPPYTVGRRGSVLVSGSGGL